MGAAQRAERRRMVLRDRPPAVVGLRHLADFLDERASADWTLPRNCRRLRVGVNLRRVSVENAMVALPTSVRDEAARRVQDAFDRLDGALLACAAPRHDTVDSHTAAAIASAVVALRDALLALLRPVPLPDHDRLR